MDLLSKLEHRWSDKNVPILIQGKNSVFFNDLKLPPMGELLSIKPGNIVLLNGDYTKTSISLLIYLFKIKTIVAPTRCSSDYQIEEMAKIIGADFVIKEGLVYKREEKEKLNPLIGKLQSSGRAGVIFFTSGSSGVPKAILHDLEKLLVRFNTPRPTLKTLAFLLFDHMGGFNTFFHAIFNCGTIVVPESRHPKDVIECCNKHEVELLPATPTFLRLLFFSNLLEKKFPKSIRIISYGTEIMDQSTLTELCKLLPKVSFRQTYGLSEFSVMRTKSLKRNSLFVKVSGEHLETKVKSGKLFLRSKNCMLGYLNYPNPFDKNGWFDTKDLVCRRKDFLKFIGRESEFVNVGGLKFSINEVESIFLKRKDIVNVKVLPRANPITGQHIDIDVELAKHSSLNLKKIREFSIKYLPPHMRPQRIKFVKVGISSRFKKIKV